MLTYVIHVNRKITFLQFFDGVTDRNGSSQARIGGFSCFLVLILSKMTFRI